MLWQDAHMQLMTWDELFITRYVAPSGEEHVQRMTDEHVRFIESHPLGATLSLAHVDMESIPPPSDRVRKLIAIYDEKVHGKLRATATIVAAGGFGGALVRSILSGLHLLKRREVANGIFASTRDALDFLSRHREPGKRSPSLDQLVTIYERACGKRAE
jgi:hypothetical protein